VAPLIAYLTAETAAGRAALEEVMAHSYRGEVEDVPAEWSLVRLAGGVPVAYILVDPERQLDMPRGSLGYAFINDVATREDRRGEGHFRAIMEEAFDRLREAGVALAVTHGRYPLYRRLGFEVFTHHAGIFVTPEQVERRLGLTSGGGAEEMLVVNDHRALQEDLLLVVEVRAGTLPECRSALQAAAALARQRGKARLLFEHPPCPSYGSRYPIYPSPETPFTALARACGAEVCLQGADPEGGSIPDADWIKVLDAAAFLGQVLPCLGGPAQALPEAVVALETGAGAVTLVSSCAGVSVETGMRAGAEVVPWPAGALAQLATGYQSAGVLSTVHSTPLSSSALALLQALFPPCWRFSRNESWTFRS
jgi:predicted N-acetyltransferase YhbS